MNYPPPGPPGYGTPYAPPSAPPPPGYEGYPPPQGYPPPPGYGGGYPQHHHHHHQPGGYQGYFNDGYPPPPPPPQPYPPTQVYHCEHSHHRDDGCFSFLKGWGDLGALMYSCSNTVIEEIEFSGEDILRM